MTPEIDEASIMRSQVAALEELLEVHERTALNVTMQLESERTRLYEVFENVPAAVIVFTLPEITIAFANQRALDVLARGNVVGRRLADVAPEVVQQGYLELLEAVGRSGEPFQQQEAPVILETPSGPEQKYFTYTFTPVRDPSGEIVAVLSHAVEVTELTKARQAVEAMVDDLRRISELSSAVNAGLSLEEVGRVAVEGTRRILEASRCALELDRAGDEDLPAIVDGEQAGGPAAPHVHIESLAARDGRPIGTLLLERATPFDDGERAIVTQIARFTSVALERGRAYEHEHKIAEFLQRSLLPRSIPDITGVRVATRYLPGGVGEEVGGDWYDVISLPDGRVAFVLGDVSGKGVRAASIMGQIRTAVRAYALGGNEPAVVLAKTDRMLQEMDPDHMVTLIYLALDIASGSLQIASAGHPPPVLIAPGRSPELVPVAPSLPLGVATHARFRVEELQLSDGAVLLLYSDGLVERRDETLDAGLGRLLEAVAGAPEDLEELCDHLLATMLPERLTDDVALLAIHADVLAARPLNLEFAAAAHEVPRVRRVLERWMGAVGVGETDSFDIVVAVGEACANAIEHAYASGSGWIRVDATLDHDEVVIHVADAGRWRPPQPQPWRGRGLKLMRSLMDEVQVERSDRGTQVVMRKRLRDTIRGATA